MTNAIKPFKIAVPESEIEALKAKLAVSTFPKEVSFSSNWDYGVPLEDVKRLAHYWRDGFDWHAQEAKLNEVPQFKTTISVDGFEDLEVHFVHQKSKRAESVPLLFSHGWPGSFLECLKILPLLTDGDSDGPSFHVVAPSLPNFGFSQGSSKPGFGIPQYAEALHKLMLQLGYDQYVTQGGDWGYIITRLIGAKYPSHCLASHLNFIRANAPTLAKHPILYLQSLLTPYTAKEKAGLARTNWFQKEGYGYNFEQSTKPSTIGFALNDSPVALLAWIYEKLHDWTDNYPWTDDEILTWVSVYQFSTAGPAASARIYYEAVHSSHEEVRQSFEYNSKVKLGLSYFPMDIIVLPRVYGRTLGPVVFEVEHEDGGHFAAHERPNVFAGDLKKMFGKGGGAYDVARKLCQKH